MSAILFFDPITRAIDANGDPIVGATWYFFESDTDTPTDVYADADFGTSLGTSVESDAAGRFPTFYMDPAVEYRARLEDQNDVLIRDIDPYFPRAPSEPPGTVVMFFGSAAARDIAYPSTFWQVCNGSGGSPDMRDRVPLGVSSTRAVGDTGGSELVNTSVAGAHDHGGATDPTVLDATNMPVHHHRLWAKTASDSDNETFGFGEASVEGLTGQLTSDGPFGYVDAGLAGTGDQLVEDAGTGTPTGHDHDIPEEPDHFHTVVTVPPYVALWFLMRKT